MKWLNSTGIRCSSSVVSNGGAELLDERRICEGQRSQYCGAKIEADKEERMKFQKKFF